MEREQPCQWSFASESAPSLSARFSLHPASEYPPPRAPRSLASPSIHSGNLNSSLFQPAWEKTEEETVAAGVRIIALDRPGYGDSSEHKGRSYKSFAQDVDCVLEKLQIGAFGVLGYSSGAPHALAIALESKRSPLALALVSSDAPYGELANKEAWA